MISIEEILEEMDAILDSSMVMPFSGGRSVIDAERMRELINDIRSHMPGELNDAKSVVAGRNDIIAAARKEAESITRKAEERARFLISEQEILRRANLAANERTVQAQAQAREIRKSALEYSSEVMLRAENIISQQLTELRQARQDLRASMRQDGGGQQGQGGGQDEPQRRRRPELGPEQ